MDKLGLVPGFTTYLGSLCLLWSPICKVKLIMPILLSRYSIKGNSYYYCIALQLCVELLQNPQPQTLQPFETNIKHCLSRGEGEREWHYTSRIHHYHHHHHDFLVCHGMYCVSHYQQLLIFTTCLRQETIITFYR